MSRIFQKENTVLFEITSEENTFYTLRGRHGSDVEERKNTSRFSRFLLSKDAIDA